MNISNKKITINITILLILINIMFVSADTDNNMSNNGASVQIDVKDTMELKVNFVPVDFEQISIQDFVSSAENNIEFINTTYPLTKDKFIPVISNSKNFSSNIGDSLDKGEKCGLLKDLYRFARLSGNDYDRVVGIVNRSWFNQHNNSGTVGYSCGGLFGNVKAVLIEDYFRHGAAHELGHTISDSGGILHKIGLCEEYDNNRWSEQDSLLDGCPNGDSNPDDGELDSGCQGYPNGCPAYTLIRLIPWLNDSKSKEEIIMYNFMGDANNTDSRWISKDSYDYLLNRFNDENLLDTIKTILVSGVIYKNNSVNLDKFYILNETTFLNETYTNGNYSIILKVNESTFYTYKFEPIFKIFNIGGDTEDTNITSFVSVLPFADNITQIILQNSTTILAKRNVSENNPLVSFTTLFEGQSYDNDFVVSWNGSDTDGDNLTYTVLLSEDGGGNFTTLALDIDETNLTVENSLLENNSNFKLRVLATDGVRTSEDISNSTFSIEPDPVVELISPEKDTRLSTNEVIFKYRTFVLNANITNCSLYINGILNLTNSSEIVKSEIMNFTQTLADGNYNWTVECTDSRGFIGETEIRKLKIGLVIPEITNVIVYPDVQEFGKNVSINATISSPIDVNLVVLNITNPEGTVREYYNLMNISSNIWGINNFTDNIIGVYNFTFFVDYGDGLSVEESGTFMMVEEIINLTRCMELDKANTVYFLTKNIYSYTTCFTVEANNITLDGQGYSIMGNYSGTGVYILNKGSVTVRNLTIKYFDKGIYFVAIPSTYVIKLYDLNAFGNDEGGIYIQQSENHLLSNIHSINNKGKGIYLFSVRKANLTNIESSYNWQEGIEIYPYSISGSSSFYLVNITTNYHTGDSGVFLHKANNTIVENLVSNENIGGEGIYLFESSNCNLTNITSNKDTSIKIDSDSSNNIIKDGIVSSLEISSSQTNTLLNVTYDNESVSSGSQLIRKWYYRAYVNDTNGNNISDANITAYNLTGNYQFNLTTDESGYTPITEIIDYINNGSNKSYYSNYTLYADNVTLSDSHSYNVTLNQNNLKDTFTLGGEGGEIIELTSCQELNEPGIYQLQNDITGITATCFTINANNIVLDMNGKNITGNISGNGVYINRSNSSAVKNGYIYGFSNGVYILSGSYNNLSNNVINSNTNGILLSSASNNNLSNNIANENVIQGIHLLGSSGNRVINNTANSNGRNGIYLNIAANNNLLANNSIWNCSKAGAYSCINVDESDKNIFDSNAINQSSKYGIWIQSAGNFAPDNADNNTFMNTNMTNINSTSVFIDDDGSSKNTNNTFINMSYNNETVDSRSQLVRKWYYQAYVNDSSGNAVSGAYVTGFNISGALQFNLTTGISGWINRTEMIEYVNTGTPKYYSLYTLYADNITLSDTHSYNVTLEKNNLNDGFSLNLI